MSVSRPAPAPRNAGFTMIEVLVTTAVLSATIYLVSGTLNDLIRSVRSSDQMTSIQSLRNILTGMVLDQTAWAQTIARNNSSNKQSPLKCWNDAKNGCSKAAPGYFSLYGADGKLYLDSYDPAKKSNMGFTTAGDVCNSFSLQKPNAKCPVRIMFKAEPICQPNTGCFKPEFKITVEFAFSFPAGSKPSWADPSKLNRELRTPGQTTPINLAGTSQTGCTTGFFPSGVNPLTGQVLCKAINSICGAGLCTSKKGG